MSRPRILLADDSITIQKVVNLTFADQGMEVVAFADGDAAVEHLDEMKPDIVLADVNMPGINGYQLCELMRSDEANKDVPVVLLVGSFEPFDRDEAERVGSNAFLTKPFTSIADLISTVQRLLDEKKARHEAGNGHAGLIEDSPEISEEAPVMTAPRPDTSDIDTLYEQSFVETVELPRSDDLNGDFGNGIDDEMIQTSYAEPDLAPPEDEDTYFAADSQETAWDATNMIETESLIAESMPADIEGESETREPVSEFEFRPDTEAQSEPAVESFESVSDPFESVAGELPPVSPKEDVSTVDPASFNLDDDLLELPGSATERHAVDSEPAVAAPAVSSTQITELSPELIDLIVDKVVERLERKQLDRAAQGG